MPIAQRLARGKAPILLNSHDLQARQFALINKRMSWLKPVATYETMLGQELEAMGTADLCCILMHKRQTSLRLFYPISGMLYYIQQHPRHRQVLAARTLLL